VVVVVPAVPHQVPTEDPVVVEVDATTIDLEEPQPAAKETMVDRGAGVATVVVETVVAVVVPARLELTARTGPHQLRFCSVERVLVCLPTSRAPASLTQLVELVQLVGKSLLPQPQLRI
jgi:hypothetical protein